ncbi:MULTISPECIES: class II aldolase/adducin family protein [unclassified Archaeoglobus]|jgi:L-fuculose-phosphate aldolase|uniref:class II aldolase/adducin family protein n=1 Tax=unclassified Archaeoglobus TaxID=2643606 RepID=UPI0025C2C2A4|nr:MULTISPECIES: class II aldolase/adducin family protein [unclassified Archaeoglobus]
MFEEAIKVGKLLAAAKLIDGASGNMSFKVGSAIYITKSGVNLDDMSENSFVKLKIGEFIREASVDQVIHQKIYEKTEYSAVLHCHGVFNVVLGARMDSIEPMDLEGKLYFGKVRVVEGQFGSPELAELISDVVKEKGVAVVRNHGMYAGGKNLRDAYNKLSYLEHSCEIIYRSILLDKL